MSITIKAGLSRETRFLSEDAAEPTSKKDVPRSFSIRCIVRFSVSQNTFSFTQLMITKVSFFYYLKLDCYIIIGSGNTVSTVQEEKKHNKRLRKPKDEFVKIMDNLNLAYPRKIGKLFI